MILFSDIEIKKIEYIDKNFRSIRNKLAHESKMIDGDKETREILEKANFMTFYFNAIEESFLQIRNFYSLIIEMMEMIDLKFFEG